VLFQYVCALHLNLRLVLLFYTDLGEAPVEQGLWGLLPYQHTGPTRSRMANALLEQKGLAFHQCQVLTPWALISGLLDQESNT
jgi:hypothetical protein